MDVNGYPNEDELNIIRRWDVIKKPMELIDYIKERWYYPDCIVVKRDKDDFFKRSIWKIEMHTVGWSGNESIIGALEQSMFWIFYWEESRRGGHYKFEVPMRDE